MTEPLIDNPNAGDPVEHAGSLQINLDSARTDQIDALCMGQELDISGKEAHRACFVVVSGQDMGRVIPLNRSVTILGRSAKCDVVLRAEGTSRYHAEIRRNRSGSFVIGDLDSTNGTIVEGKKIKKATLKEGDKIVVGRNAVLRFSLQNRLEYDCQQRLYEACILDGLTGAFNRRYFLEQIVSDLSFARRHRMPSTLLLFDLDHFKAVNDTYGHQCGDRVLISISNTVSSTIRTEDILSRYGGEEFAILAQGIDRAGGEALGERIRSQVAAEPVLLMDRSNSGIPITVSVGVITVNPGAVVDSNRVISAADKNLYGAKQRGRNQVVATEIR